MSKSKNFIKNTVILFLGKASTQFLSFFLLPLYTSLLTTSEYGTVDLISTYVIFFSPLLCLQIESAGFRFLVNKRNDEKATNEIIKSISVFVIKAMIILSIVFITLNIFIKIKYFIYIYVYTMLYMFFSLNQQIARGKGKNVDFAISSCLYGVTLVVSNIILIVFLKLGIIGLLASYLIATSVSLIFMLIANKTLRIIICTKVENQKKIVKECIKYSAPLIPNSISWWVLNVSDRTIITVFLSAAANGIYSISNKFSSIYIGFFNIVNLAWVETVSLHIHKDDKFISELFNTIIKFFTIISILMIAVIPIIYPYFIGKSFYSSFYYVPILMLASIFNVLFGLTQGIYVGLKKTKELAKTSIVCAIINIIINISLIKFIGIYAAAVSTLVAYITLFVYQYINVNKYYKISFDFKGNTYLLFMFLIGMIIFYINHLYVSIAYVIIATFIILVFNKDSIKRVLEIMLHQK